MAIIDNTLAAQVPQFNLANTLQQGAQAQAAQDAVQAEQLKAKQNAVGAEMRGVAPFVNSPDFPAKWAQAADNLLKSGAIDPNTHQQIVNSPSPLMLKSIIAKTEDPALTFQKDEAQRAQGNADRSYSLQKTNADRTYGLAARAADRADQTPLEAMQEKAAAAEAAGLEPGTPEYKAYSLTGSLPASATADPAALKTLTPGGEIYHSENGKVVIDHKNDKGVNAEDVPESTINFAADRIRMGDSKATIGFARNPGLIARIQTAADQREAAGIPITDQARAVVHNGVNLSARGAAERNLATISNKNETFGNMTLGAIDLAEKASEAVPRTDYPGVNKALNAYRKQTGNTEIRALGAGLNTLINDYARYSGGGQGSDSLRAHAEEMLSGADSHPQLLAITDMMRKEIVRGMQAPGNIRKGYDALYEPKGGAAAKPAPADRFKQLVGTGLSKDEAYAKMHEEGY